MPIYELKCRSCGEVFEMYRAILGDTRGIKCPNCGGGSIERTISPFSSNNSGSQSCGISFPT